LNGTTAPSAVVAGAHELFSARSRRRFTATAVVCGDERLTYGELEERSNRLAHYMRGLGVDTESVVGLCFERSLDLIVAILAVWKAGGAYLPLDLEYPPERLSYMLTDARVSVLFGTAHAIEDLPAARIRIRPPWPRSRQRRRRRSAPPCCGIRRPTSSTRPVRRVAPRG
jgi:non-ribosomal peptide synthetase component F